MIKPKTPSAFDALNPAQRRAATFGSPATESGPLLILAGAGTGKTNTLAHRAAHLVLNGVDPGRIMMLTFTRRAAQEMIRRAQQIVGETLAERGKIGDRSVVSRLLWSGTFHSVGSRILRLYAKHLGLNPNFTVLDRTDAADLMDVVRHELGFSTKEKRFPRKDACLAIYSYRVNTRLPLKQTIEEHTPWCREWEQDLTRLYREYVARKQKLNVLDFDDLLLYWHVMMQTPALANSLSKNFDHVLVDEYQDTSALQGEIVQALKPDGKGVTVVGDDAQAIYSFRAAAVENILGFADRYTPKAEIVVLAQNYRSTQQILDCANALMAEGSRQHRKTLMGTRQSAQKLTVRRSVFCHLLGRRYVLLRTYCTRSGRWPSPKFIAGEKSGTTRAARLSGYLQGLGLSVNGVVLSPVLELPCDQLRAGQRSGLRPLPSSLRVRCLVPQEGPGGWHPASQQCGRRPRFASSEYRAALQKGDALGEAERASVIEGLARLTGLSRRSSGTRNCASSVTSS